MTDSKLVRVERTRLDGDSDAHDLSPEDPAIGRWFFDDPRTRAEYFKWAPYMLAAEEWHAGRRSGVTERSDNENDED